MITSTTTAGGSVDAGFDAEEKRIRDVWERLARAWSAADPHGVAGAWDDDADHRRIGAAPRPDARGRRELERSLATAFLRRGGRRRQLSCRISSVRFIRDDVAIVDGVLYVSASGTARPALTEPLTAVMTKRDGEWLIAASRVTAPQVVDPGGRYRAAT
jgi:uncharacterized protein (TIGR02246 family)